MVQSPGLKIGGAVAAAVIVVGLLVWLIVSLLGGSGGIPAWAVYFVPENAKVIAYANVDKLRSSDPAFQNLADKRAMQIPDELPIDDVSEVFLAGCGFAPPNDEPMIVVRMKRDHPLTDMLPKAQRGGQPQNFKNVEYVGLGKSRDGREKVVAKIGDGIFCCAPSEDMLKQALQRKERKERAKLDANLQAGLDAVAGGNVYIAGINVKDGAVPVPVDRFHAGVWVSSSVEIVATVVFSNAADAAKCKQMYDGFVGMAGMFAGDRKKEIDKLISGISIQQDGNELNCKASWATKDLVALANKAKEARGQFPGQPGAGSRVNPVPRRRAPFPGQPGAPPPAIPGGMPR